MAIVSKMLRHSSIHITVATYSHLSVATARTASDAMGALLGLAFETAAAAATLRPQLPSVPPRRSS
jgi:hypothetical protein